MALPRFEKKRLIGLIAILSFGLTSLSAVLLPGQLVGLGPALFITGFFILGTTYAAWRYDHERRILWASVLAVVLTPVQFLLGANTIFNFGAISQVIHHAAALAILVALVAATLWAYEE